MTTIMSCLQRYDNIIQTKIPSRRYIFTAKTSSELVPPEKYGQQRKQRLRLRLDRAAAGAPSGPAGGPTGPLGGPTGPAGGPGGSTATRR